MQRGRVERMTYGPHGLVRVGGKVVFLRHVAPGDEVEFETREDRGSFAFGEWVRLLYASPERRKPPCPYLPRCGGCPWQHLPYEAQLRFKQQNLEDHLRRIAKLDAIPFLPPIAAPSEFGYRHRLSLRVEGGRLGFFAGGSHELVEIEECLLGNETLNACLAPVAELVRSVQLTTKRVELVAEEHAPRAAVVLEAEGGWRQDDDQRLVDWLQRMPLIAGAVARGRGWRRIWGDPTLRVQVASDCELRVHAGVFTQVNPAANRELVRVVLERLAGSGAGYVVDAYCGAGNFTLPLVLRGARVIAIEQDAQACADLRANLARAGASARVIEAPAHRAFRRLLQEQAQVDALLLDPPRGGAGQVVEQILELRPARVVYVSCHSAALARDLAALLRRYQVESVQLLDLFPQTYHAEVVATLVLTC